MEKKTLLAGLILSLLFILLWGCSDYSDYSNQDEIPDPVLKERDYGDALLDLHGHSTVNSQENLDKRFHYLERQIDDILTGQELHIAQFTRIKIELDYLQISNYSAGNMTQLSKKFQQAYAQAASSVEEITGTLGDRYNTLNRTINRVYQGEENLTVSLYLQLDQGLVQLEEDGYMIPARLHELQTLLLTSVINELQHAIIDVPDIDPDEDMKEDQDQALIADEIADRMGDEAVEKIDDEMADEKIIEPRAGPSTHTIRLINGGFDQERVSIYVGDTIEWMNVRDGQYKIAFIIGNGKCREINSGIFKEGLSYNWTFAEPGLCLISDGIFTTQVMKVRVQAG